MLPSIATPVTRSEQSGSSIDSVFPPNASAAMQRITTAQLPRTTAPWVIPLSAVSVTCPWTTGPVLSLTPEIYPSEVEVNLTMSSQLLLLAVSASAASASSMDPEIKTIYVAPEGNEVRIEANLTSPAKPVITVEGNPPQLVIKFPEVSFAQHSEYLSINRNGVKDVHAESDPDHPATTRIVAEIGANHPYAVKSAGNKFVLSILPVPSILPASTITQDLQAPGRPARPAQAADPSIATREQKPRTESPTKPHGFKVKYIAANTIYLDGGSNSGLQVGMTLRTQADHAPPAPTDDTGSPLPDIVTVRVIGVAANSVICESETHNGELHVGDLLELSEQDAVAASHNVATRTEARRTRTDLREGASSSSSDSAPDIARSFRSAKTQTSEPGTRLAARIGFDYSSISSKGSTAGISTQRGISFQSDMTNILGTHWNLQGYWRGRVNDHSQFQEPTIQESLNKTYTMQLYYSNPKSHWATGIGRLYLPWAVSLDTIDGAYVARKWSPGITTGLFAGTTPDINSWHYRPNQRTGGTFVNFQGGNYDNFHFSTTVGAGVNTIVWKLDRPFAFFESEASYKDKLSFYHSLIADARRGVSTEGARLAPGISHSYFTAHYMPSRALSLDLYHNYFRDMPTATTTIVGTGVVDKLLFQGLSGGVHVKPMRNVALYSSLGVSQKTGDSHRSLTQMFGGSWSEIAHSGFRADFHYSKFDSNFGKGSYNVFSLSRQITNRAFWNVQVGKQNLLSHFTTNHNSIYVDDSFDVNIGRRSYLQSGYTYVNGATMNYRQLYFSWGFRLDRGRNAPEFVETQSPVH
ncbi:AMIN domain-containing protein [Acidobacteria bacterium AB60]|nr:AMIN domain-containing protein [Acidobacteria bacterium AB60]